MKPRTRNEFKEYCLRTLGKPVINIELDPDQVDDRIDQGLEFYYDHHFDGSEQLYYKYQIQEHDYPDRVKDVIVVDGGTGYSNTDTVEFLPVNNVGSNGTATVITDSNGAITSLAISNTGTGFQLTPNVVITSSGGSGANVVPQMGGYIQIPENVIGVVEVFNVQSALNTGSFFSLKYQIALNDLYSFYTVSLVPYYLIRLHLATIEELLIGKQPIRYNRHKNKMYLDMDWSLVVPGDFLIISCYEVIDPHVYPDVWSDYWLHKYCTQLLKQQWGSNIKKYGNMRMPDGTSFNGQIIYDEATEEITKMERDVIIDYSPILHNMTG